MEFDELNYQTKGKIEKIKNSIKNGEDLKEILKKYFTNSNTKKNDWLEKFGSFLTDEELKYLDYKEVVENKEEIEKSISQSVSDNSLTIKNEEAPVLPNELNLYFKNEENIKTLIKIIENYKHKENQFVIVEDGFIEIPSEVLRIKNTGSISIKSNLEQYEEIKKLALKNSVPIANFINFIFWDFLKRYN
jgi:hypothetical protein